MTSDVNISSYIQSNDYEADFQRISRGVWGFNLAWNMIQTVIRTRAACIRIIGSSYDGARGGYYDIAISSWTPSATIIQNQSMGAGQNPPVGAIYFKYETVSMWGEK